MQVIEIDNIKYPAILKQIVGAPKVLYVEGDIELLNKNLIAIIGSRNYTEYGEIQAKRFAKKLSKAGIGIISGMALGIDTFAHIETIKNGGKTIAVLGSGFNHIYPKENKELFELIVKTGGTVISEYPPDTRMQKKYFPLRNRIVSGLALGTLVVEATYRSGTSITANFAWKQGRKVYCIPNSINNKNSCGTINLLKQGAKLVTKPKEILDDLGELNNKVILNSNLQFTNKDNQILNIDNFKNIMEPINFENYNEETKKVIKVIQQSVEADSSLISQLLQMPVSKVNSILTSLEIDEVIQSTISGKYKICN